MLKIKFATIKMTYMMEIFDANILIQFVIEETAL